MKRSISALFFYLVFISIAWGQTLPIFQVPINNYTTKNGLSSSTLSECIIYENGLVQVLGYGPSTFIIGNEVLEHTNENLDISSSLLIRYNNGKLLMANEKNIVLFDFKTLVNDTILNIDFNTVISFDISEQFLSIYRIDSTYLLYDLKGNLINENKFDKEVSFLNLDNNSYFTHNKNLNQLLKIDGRSGTSCAINLTSKNDLLVETLTEDYALVSDKGLLWLVNFKEKSVEKIENWRLEKEILWNLSSCYWKENKYIITSGITIFIFDLDLKKITHEIKNQRNELILYDGSIREIDIDKNEFLYAITIRNGIIKCDLKNPFYRINNASKSEQFAKNVLLDEEMNFILYTNWFNNLIIHDTQGQILHEIILNNDAPVLLIGAYKISKGKYLLAYEETNLHKIITFDGTGKYTIENLTSDGQSFSGFYGKEIENDEEKIVIHFEGEFLKYNKKTKQLTFQKFLDTSLDPRTGVLIDNFFYIQDNAKLKKFSYPEIHLVDSIALGKVILVRDIIKKDNNSIWIAHDHGLVEVDVLSKKITPLEKINECIYTIELFEGKYYLGTNNGIIVLKDNEIIDRIALQDELANSEFNTNAKFLTENALYLGSTSGIVVINKDDATQRSNHAEIMPFKITIDQSKELFFTDISDLNKVITLNPDESNIEVVFANLSPYFHDNIVYQYALNDQPGEWESLRNNFKLILNLSPGKYKLYYAGSRFFNKSIEKTKYLTIIVKAKWYKTVLFRILLASFLIGGLAFSYISFITYRSREKIKKISLEKKFEQDKNRIAMDLHDNIGMNLSLLKRNLDFISDQKTQLSSDEIFKKIDFLSEVSGDVGRALRDSIWAAKRERFTISDMIERVESLVKSFELNPSVQKIVLTNQLNNTTNSFSPSQILNLYRIIQEAIHNAVKHSNASIIEVKFHREVNSIHCQIIDNGTGFNLELISQSGLKNMYLRAKNEGFNLTIDSKVNQFTSVGIIIPYEI